MSRTRRQEIFHLVAMIGFVGVGVGLAATCYRVTMDATSGTLRSAGAYLWLGMLLTGPFAFLLIVGAVGINVTERAAPPADTERQSPARR